MAGVVYLKTNHFEVKLEGITFKANDFGRLCIEDFLFPEGKVWVRPPIVGIDIMRHPRDPTILLVILCFGLGCVILRFHSGAAIPEPIQRFFTDKRIQFVGFGIPEKTNLFPFDELGLVKEKTDIGYLAAKILDNPKYIKADLGMLAYKILGIKRMFGLTQVSYFERHEQIKSAVCQLFITSVIAMALFSTGENVKAEECSCSCPSRKSSFLKNLSSLPSLTEGWFKLPKASRKEEKYSPERGNNNLRIHTTQGDHTFLNSHWFMSKNKKGSYGHNNDLTHVRCKESSDDSSHSDGSYDAWNRVKEARVEDIRGSSDDNTKNDDSIREAICRKPLKGILKCPSSPNGSSSSSNGSSSFEANSSPSTPKVQSSGQGLYRRANSKGHNVTFKFK